MNVNIGRNGRTMGRAEDLSSIPRTQLKCWVCWYKVEQVAETHQALRLSSWEKDNFSSGCSTASLWRQSTFRNDVRRCNYRVNALPISEKLLRTHGKEAHPTGTLF